MAPKVAQGSKDQKSSTRALRTSDENMILPQLFEKKQKKFSEKTSFWKIRRLNFAQFLGGGRDMYGEHFKFFSGKYIGRTFSKLSSKWKNGKKRQKRAIFGPVREIYGREK